MMIIVVVTFKINSEITEAILKEKFLETSPIYKDTPGLIRKNYISEPSNNLAGGFTVLIIWLMQKSGLMKKELIDNNSDENFMKPFIIRIIFKKN